MDELIVTTRARIQDVAARLSAIPDEALDREWMWRGAKRTLRHGLYRPHEIIDEAQASLAAGMRVSPAGVINSKVTAARWDLHGLLLPAQGIVDEQPGADWSLRMILSHLINAHEFWAWQTGHWVSEISRGAGLPLAGYVRDKVPAALVKQPDRMEGTLVQLREKLDLHVDAGLDNVIALETHGCLDEPVKFQGAVVTARYLPVRWSAHLREHRIQVETTLHRLHHVRTEVDSIVARLLAALGELEGAMAMVPEASARPVVDAALEEIDRLSVELTSL